MKLLNNKLQPWKQGICNDAHTFLGAHPAEEGMQFCVWAPHAQSIDVVGDFNNWKQGAHQLALHQEMGCWYGTVANAELGQRYKYAVTGPEGKTVLKSDPYAFFAEQGSHHASILYQLPSFNWSDEEWMNRRQEYQQPSQPMSIYEVHLGSWKHNNNGQPLTYRQLAKELVPYVKEMGFTHIELMPVMEHPYGPSWGYQVTGFFAPTSRYGKPEDLMAFVDACHTAGIGVILDWVPGHFPKDEHGLRYFDGTPLYEHQDERRREHADWDTHNFDLGKPGVRNFLLSNFFYWSNKYHIDGFRFDAVASMLYLDYSKEEGEWLPNKFGGNKNLDAVAFLQDLNDLAASLLPSVLRIAEESTAWARVTQPVSDGGLGFDYKWNMGWMNDTLHYFQQAADKRGGESYSITFPRSYAFSEQFILPLSHDEVVHLKKSLWSKMPGSPAEKFDQLRLLYLYMIACPGKKLLFMGSELAVPDEWSEARELPWKLLEHQPHKNLQQYLSSLLSLYRAEPVLYQTDHEESQFRWVDLSLKEEGVFCFSRQVKDNSKVLFLFNFSDNSISNYSNNALQGKSHTIKFASSLDESDTREEVKNGVINLQPFQGLMLEPY